MIFLFFASIRSIHFQCVCIVLQTFLVQYVYQYDIQQMFHLMQKKFRCRPNMHHIIGNSVYNTIEICMVPPSRSMCGTVIDHKHHGNHLNASKKTIDEDLERKNFYHAQKALASIFKQVVVNGNRLQAEAIKPMKSTTDRSKFEGNLSKKHKIFLHKHAQEESSSWSCKSKW